MRERKKERVHEREERKEMRVSISRKLSLIVRDARFVRVLLKLDDEKREGGEGEKEQSEISFST